MTVWRSRVERVRAAQRAVSEGAARVAVQHQVSQNAVRRWMRRYGLDTEPAPAAGSLTSTLWVSMSTAGLVAALWVGGLWGFGLAATAAVSLTAAVFGRSAARGVADDETARLRGEIAAALRYESRVHAETLLLAEINRRLTPRVDTFGQNRRMSQLAAMPATAYELLAQIDESRAAPAAAETLQAVFDRVDSASGLPYRERMDALADILDILDMLDMLDAV